MSLFIGEIEVPGQKNNVEKKKRLLKKKVVRYLYFHGPKSAIEISKKLKTSIPTITSTIAILCKNGILSEEGQGNSSGGRRPLLYGLCRNSLYILGIDIGRYTTKMAIYNSRMEALTGLQHYEIALVNDEKFLDHIQTYAQQLIIDSNIDKEKIIGIGIDMPGLVDSENGRNFTYFTQESGTLAQLLTRKFGLPVYIENDAKARALAEFRFGLAKGRKNVLVLHVGWGVGLGMILNGKLYRGHNGFAGEFSHIHFSENGLLCSCGKSGCLETEASGKALVRHAEESIAKGKNSNLAELLVGKSNENLHKIIIDAADSGDQLAISIISKVGLELGKGMSTLIQLFNPELIILGGRMADANRYLLTPIQQSLNHYCLRKIGEQTEIALSELGANANILGAVAMVVENTFEI
jgi:N-acetylglucosamine repressor